VPTSPFAASVPRSIFPFSVVASVNPDGQDPEAINRIAPEGTACPPILGMDGQVPESGQMYTPPAVRSTPNSRGEQEPVGGLL
jgi:hypothetical protein